MDASSDARIEVIVNGKETLSSDIARTPHAMGAGKVTSIAGRQRADRGPGHAVNPARCRVLVADDHDLVRIGLGRLLHQILPEASVDEAGSGEALDALLAASPPPNLLIVDLAMPGFDGEAAVAALLARHPVLPILVVSGDASPACIARLLGAGVRGFLPKSLDGAQMVKAIELVLAGGRYLPPDLLACVAPAAEARSLAQRAVTPRQQDILGLLLEGLPNKLIAARLDLAEATVKMHVTALLRRYGVRSRAELLARLR